jgi:hypothetical protein
MIELHRESSQHSEGTMQERWQPDKSDQTDRSGLFGVISTAVGSIYNLTAELTVILFATAVTSVFAVCMILSVIFIRAIVLSFTWAWFITPIFGIRAITVYESVGLSIFVSVLLPQYSHQKSESGSAFARKHRALSLTINAVSEVLMAPGILFCVGWVWHNYFSNTF